MKKFLLALLLASSLTAHADNEFRYTPNNAGGYIFFTYSNCVYVNTQEHIPGKFYVYSTNSNGMRITDGCYSYKAPFYVIDWNSGGRTNINASSTQEINTK